MNTLVKAVGATVVAFAVIALVGALVGFPIKWLWNGVMPDLFHVSRIGFWQAVMLYLLTQALFTKSSSSSSKSSEGRS